MSRTRIIIWLFSLLPALNAAEAQQLKKIPHNGFLVSASAASQQSRFQAFKQGLAELGYVDGTNIMIDGRYAEGKVERLPDLASDLASRKVDVFVVGDRICRRASKHRGLVETLNQIC
jgi:putative ABC transport system substrate-binding protein